MKCLAAIIASAALAWTAAPSASAAWEVPMTDFEVGGFDHIQIRMAPGFQFDSPATDNFAAFDGSGFDPRGFEWSSLFLNNNRNFTVATGPGLGESLLAYTLYLDGNPATDRPSFHYQSYLEGGRVGNYDFYNVANTGLFEADWVVLPGTWGMNQAIPAFIPGDANRDASVDIYDIVDHWQLHYTGPGGSGMTWEQGDWNGDGSVDIYDVVDHWQLNYTGPVSGPPPLASRQLELLQLAAQGRSPSATTALALVPEPASAAVIGAAILLFSTRRREVRQ